MVKSLSGLIPAGFSLYYIVFFKIFFQVVEHPLFVAAPERGDELLFGSVPGEAMDADLFRQTLNAAGKQGKIFLHAQGLELPGTVVCGKVGVLQHM